MKSGVLPGRVIVWSCALGFLLAVPTLVAAEPFTVPGSAATIQGAINLAKANGVSGDTIEVSEGHYADNLVVTESLTIEAKDGDRVDLSGAPGKPLIDIQGPNVSVTLQRLILHVNGVGVRVVSAGATIRNLAIVSATTGVECSASTVEISQTTFYGGQDGIVCTGSSPTVKNNIFSGLTGIPISVSNTNQTPNTITNNLFFQTRKDITLGSTPIIDQDPLFVDPNAEEPDFHLRAGSPAIDAGDQGKDLGAYGGDFASSVPFPPRDAAVSCPVAISCTVSWSVNADHLVTGYLVYFAAPLVPAVGPTSYSGTATVETVAVTSPVKRTDCCQVVLDGLDPTVTAPAAPTGLTTTFGDAHVVLGWSSVAGATVYRVYYDVFSPPSTPFDPPKSSTTRDITGLVNGVTYFFAVQGVAVPTLTVAVASVYGTDAVGKPGDVIDAAYGTAVSGAVSTPVSEMPEPVVAFPPLEDAGGCFIATAAYGSPMAPQVDVLRLWRDRHLRPHWLGRVFIRAYEALSPPLADIIRDSARLRAGARVLLWPVVGAAALWLAWPWAPAVVAAGCLVAVFVRRRRLARG